MDEGNEILDEVREVPKIHSSFILFSNPMFYLNRFTKVFMYFAISIVQNTYLKKIRETFHFGNCTDTQNLDTTLQYSFSYTIWTVKSFYFCTKTESRKSRISRQELKGWLNTVGTYGVLQMSSWKMPIFYDSMLKLKPKEILTSQFQKEEQINFCILYWMRQHITYSYWDKEMKLVLSRKPIAFIGQRKIQTNTF